MGAHNFHTTMYGETASEAYRDAVDDALFEEGHNPYNGTISTTNGFTIIPLRKGETVAEWSDRVIEDEGIRKWEECACVADPDEPIENGRTLWHFAGWASC